MKSTAPGPADWDIQDYWHDIELFHTAFPLNFEKWSLTVPREISLNISNATTNFFIMFVICNLIPSYQFFPYQILFIPRFIVTATVLNLLHFSCFNLKTWQSRYFRLSFSVNHNKISNFSLTLNFVTLPVSGNPIRVQNICRYIWQGQLIMHYTHCCWYIHTVIVEEACHSA